MAYQDTWLTILILGDSTQPINDFNVIKTRFKPFLEKEFSLEKQNPVFKNTTLKLKDDVDETGETTGLKVIVGGPWNGEYGTGNNRYAFKWNIQLKNNKSITPEIEGQIRESIRVNLRPLLKNTLHFVNINAKKYGSSLGSYDKGIPPTPKIPPYIAPTPTPIPTPIPSFSFQINWPVLLSVLGASGGAWYLSRDK